MPGLPPPVLYACAPHPALPFRREVGLLARGREGVAGAASVRADHALAPHRHPARLAQGHLPIRIALEIDDDPAEPGRLAGGRILDRARAGGDGGRGAVDLDRDAVLGRRLDRLLAGEEERDPLGFQVGAAQSRMCMKLSA